MNADLSEAFGSELVLVGASDTDGLLAYVRRLANFLEQAPGVELSDVSFTCARDYAANRGAALEIVASNVADLRARLISAAARIADGAARVRDKSCTYYFYTILSTHKTSAPSTLYPLFFYLSYKITFLIGTS